MATLGRLYFVFAFVCLGTQATVAGQQECKDAIDRYNSAVEDVSSALRRYANCVSGSQGNDDCSSEFRRVRSAHSEFEDAAIAYQSEFRR